MSDAANTAEPPPRRLRRRRRLALALHYLAGGREPLGPGPLGERLRAFAGQDPVPSDLGEAVASAELGDTIPPEAVLATAAILSQLIGLDRPPVPATRPYLPVRRTRR